MTKAHAETSPISMMGLLESESLTDPKQSGLRSLQLDQQGCLGCVIYRERVIMKSVRDR